MINNETYTQIIFDIANKSNRKIDKNNYLSSIQYAKESIKKANETEESLLNFLNENKEIVIMYSIKKLTTLSNVEDKDDDDDWETDEGDEDEIIEEMGLSMTFLIYYLNELILIKKGNEELEKYLKKIRIPNAKKYANELREIYNSIKEK
ncbi:MAG: hypothetical protein R2790_02195 [Flavobacterium haoranii]